MKVLVTGGAGFIGSYAAKALVDSGNEVVVADDLSYGSRDNVPDGAQFVLTDLSRRTTFPKSIFDVECVLHFAAVARTMECEADVVRSNEINLNMTVNMLEASARCGVQRFVYASSNILYAPPSAYKIQKQAAESYVSLYAGRLSTISLRFGNVYGTKRQSERGAYPNVLASMNRSAKKYGYVTVEGDGLQTRDFLHVKDAAVACELAVRSDVSGVFDICTGNNTAILEVAQSFNLPIKFVPARKNDAREIEQDPCPAEDALGFRAGVGFAEGIKAYHDE